MLLQHYPRKTPESIPIAAGKRPALENLSSRHETSQLLCGPVLLPFDFLASGPKTSLYSVLRRYLFDFVFLRRIERGSDGCSDHENGSSDDTNGAITRNAKMEFARRWERDIPRRSGIHSHAARKIYREIWGIVTRRWGAIFHLSSDRFAFVCFSYV